MSITVVRLVRLKIFASLVPRLRSAEINFWISLKIN
jgi:hypothetical protein